MSDFYIRQGDHGERLSDTLKDAAGAAVDLQGATITLTVTPVNGGAPILNAVTAANDQNASGVDGTKGKVHYVWQASQTVTAGLYFAGWAVTFTDGSVQTYPNGSYLLVEITPTAPATTPTRFATSAELAARLGLTFTADEHVRANVMLALASGIIQQKTKQTISLVTGEAYTRKGSADSRIRLPQRPVVSVASVVLDGVTMDATSYFLDGSELVRRNWSSVIIDSSFGLPFAAWGYAWSDLVITYTHGYSVIPELVKTTCIEMVVRAWVNPGSVIQEAVAGVQTTYAPYSAPPRGLQMTDDEYRDLQNFLGRPHGTITLR